MSLFDVVVQSICFNQSPDTAFVAMTPPIQSLNILVPVSDRSECPVASMVYVLQVLRVGEEHDDGKDLIATFRRSWAVYVLQVRYLKNRSVATRKK